MKKILKQGLADLSVGNISEDVLTAEIIFLEELLRWNIKINLTAVTDRTMALEKHLLDSLVLMPYLEREGEVADIGSGAGLPCIPLAIALPGSNFISVESVGKKTNFQKHIRRSMGLKNLEIVCSRVQDLCQQDSQRRNFNLVVARALAPMKELLPLAEPLVRPGGTIIAMKGPEGAGELNDAYEKWPEAFDKETQLERYSLPISGAERCLIFVRKKNHNENI